MSIENSNKIALEAINNFLEDKRELGNYNLPLVTIIVTNYNYEKYLHECLLSVMDQDYPFIQKIVVDDDSSDNSKEILKEYEKDFEVIYKKENEGQLGAFFSGLKRAKGDFIIFVDADDVLDKEVVSAHLAIHLFHTPQVAFSCVRNRQISADSTLLSEYHLDFDDQGQLMRYVSPRVIHTPTWSWGTTSGMMFRNDVLELIVTDNIKPFRICADYYIVHFANLLGGSMLFDKALVNYRRHGSNGFSKNRIIGGKKPTGHLKYHSHPEHKQLQQEIISKLLAQREQFEPYYGKIEEYAKLLAYVQDADEVLNEYNLENDLKEALLAIKDEVAKEKAILIKNSKKG